MYKDIAVIFVASVAAAQLLLSSLVKMLYNSRVEKVCAPNYAGKLVPAVGGIVFIPVAVISVLLFSFTNIKGKGIYTVFLVIVLCMGFIGVVDDLIGDGSIKGYKKHFMSMLEGNMTTGFFKAFLGFAVSFLGSIQFSDSIYDLVINTLIITLTANTLNLFDLRPGRTLKVFFASSLLLFIPAMGRINDCLPFFTIFTAAVMFFPYDLKEICMLGDTGAYILGASLGFYGSLLLSDTSKIPVLLTLVMVNIIAEKISFSEIIENNRILAYLDSIGRRKARTDDKNGKRTSKGDNL